MSLLWVAKSRVNRPQRVVRPLWPICSRLCCPLQKHILMCGCMYIYIYIYDITLMTSTCWSDFVLAFLLSTALTCCLSTAVFPMDQDLLQQTVRPIHRNSHNFWGCDRLIVIDSQNLKTSLLSTLSSESETSSKCLYAHVTLKAAIHKESVPGEGCLNK